MQTLLEALRPGWLVPFQLFGIYGILILAPVAIRELLSGPQMFAEKFPGGYPLALFVAQKHLREFMVS
jgi:hypothetical protein